jgi:hypothetical protein
MLVFFAGDAGGKDGWWRNNQIHLRRRFIRGKVSESKSRKAKASVAIGVLLANTFATGRKTVHPTFHDQLNTGHQLWSISHRYGSADFWRKLSPPRNA